MATEDKYRIGAYVNRETWEILTDYQKQVKAATGKNLLKDRL